MRAVSADSAFVMRSTSSSMVSVLLSLLCCARGAGDSTMRPDKTMAIRARHFIANLYRLRETKQNVNRCPEIDGATVDQRGLEPHAQRRARRRLIETVTEPAHDAFHAELAGCG